MKNNDKIELYNQFIRIHNKFALIKRKQIYVSNTANVHPAEMQVLCLVNSSKLTVTDIASNLSITKSAASQLVKKLCSKNMLQKFRSEENERFVVLKVTDKGKTAVDDFFDNESHVFGEMAKEFSSISNQELKIIGLFLTKLEEMFDKKLQ
jgi:DNA-binding MarR family transcriptional regulator